jgi:protein-S-isoprenylcysteine O-methyltransferase Ste14
MNRSALVFTIVPLAAIAFLVYRFAHPPWTPLRIAGLILMFPSLALVALARYQLGRSFSLSPQARQLVTYGLYSRIRNPIYVFSAIALFGLILFLDKLDYLWLFVILIPLQLFRARAEARLLEQKFGEDYRRYKSKTWF